MKNLKDYTNYLFNRNFNSDDFDPDGNEEHLDTVEEIKQNIHGNKSLKNGQNIYIKNVLQMKIFLIFAICLFIMVVLIIMCQIHINLVDTYYTN